MRLGRTTLALVAALPLVSPILADDDDLCRYDKCQDLKGTTSATYDVNTETPLDHNGSRCEFDVKEALTEVAYLATQQVTLKLESYEQRERQYERLREEHKEALAQVTDKGWARAFELTEQNTKYASQPELRTWVVSIDSGTNCIASVETVAHSGFKGNLELNKKTNKIEWQVALASTHEAWSAKWWERVSYRGFQRGTTELIIREYKAYVIAWAHAQRMD